MTITNVRQVFLYRARARVKGRITYSFIVCAASGDEAKAVANAYLNTLPQKPQLATVKLQTKSAVSSLHLTGDPTP